MKNSTTLNNLILDFNSKYSTYYKNELYAHTPMVLQSLKELGASDARIEEYYQFDIKKLFPIKDSDFRIDDQNWKKNFGDISLELPYARYFLEKINKDGVDNVIADVFDTLMEGVGAAAFHPIIRLYYAVVRGDKKEIALSLGTWAISFLDIKVDLKLGGTKTIIEVLKDLSDFNNGEQLVATNIAFRMQEVAKFKEFHKAAASVSLENISNDKLEESLLYVFSQTNNFTLLHGVTSHHAFEFLNKFSKDKEKSRTYYWKAVLAAYLSTTGFARVELDWQYPKVILKSWDELIEIAINHQDNHVIKLVHTLNLKDKSRLDHELKYAASVKLGLIN